MAGALEVVSGGCENYSFGTFLEFLPQGGQRLGVLRLRWVPDRREEREHRSFDKLIQGSGLWLCQF